jgi:HPt (histidine-containing phosphotransfer) domain-containing protein
MRAMHPIKTCACWSNFVTVSRISAEQFAAARLDADPDAAMRRANTLHGTAGNIGASAVQAAATTLEAACKKHASDAVIDAALQRVRIELAPVIAGLDVIRVEQAGDSHPVVDLDRDRVRPQLNKLCALLVESDTDAAELAEELATLTVGTGLAADLRKVNDMIAGFDFDEALAMLDELLKRHRMC